MGSQLPNKMRGLEFALLLFSLLLTNGTCKSMTFNMTNIQPHVRNRKGLASILIRTGNEEGDKCDLTAESTLGFDLFSSRGHCAIKNLNSSPGKFAANSVAVFVDDQLEECQTQVFDSDITYLELDFDNTNSDNDQWCLDFVIILFHDAEVFKCNKETVYGESQQIRCDF